MLLKPQFEVLPCGSPFLAGSEMRNGAKISAKAGLPVTILKWHGLQLKIRVEVKRHSGVHSGL